MKYFDNYKTVDLDMLRESGMYSEQLLKVIEVGNHIELGRPDLISKEQRQDIHFMGPIVYAFEKAHRTYIGYKYCDENLQKKPDFAIDIIREAPEIIIDTPASNDREFIEKVATEIPEVVKHMSAELKADSTFTVELCKLNVPEVTKYAAQECKMPDTIEENLALANNKDFMLGVIKNDSNALEYASDELKNDYEFIKEACANNKGAIKYVSEHTGEFGAESLKGAQEVLKDQFNGRLEQDCKDEVERIKKEIEDKKQQGIEVEPKLEYRAKNLENRPERIKARIAQIEEGDEKAIRFAKKVLKNCKLDDSYREMLEQALKIGEAIREKQKETAEKVSEQENGEITKQAIETATEGAILPSIEEETSVTRKGIEERSGALQHTKEEIEIDD